MKKYATFMALLCSSVAVPALAQTESADSESAGTENEDIVVTALKGNTTAQQAPTTVVVVDGEELSRQSIVAVERLQTVVPGVRFQQSPGGLINPVVRGLGTSSTVSSFEQSIGLFIDGVFAGHSREYSNALFDVSRIELLKGTQAAVVGKSTSLGALSVVTNRPRLGEFGYNLSYGHEFEFGGDTVTGMVNLPVGDTFAIRVAGLYDQQGGWITNAFGLADSPSTERIGVRISARWQPNDALDWTVYGQYTEYDQQGQFFHIGIDNAGAFAAAAASLGDASFVPRRFENRYSPRPGFSRFGFTEPGSRNDAFRVTSVLSYDLGPATITATTGYGEYDDAYMFDGFGLAQSPLIGSGTEYDETFSQELRIGSNGDGPFSYILGGYYYHDKWGTNTYGDYIFPLVPAIGSVGIVDQYYDQVVETISVFGQLGYRITDALQLQGSLRYEHIDKSGTYRRTANATATGASGLANAATGTYPLFGPDPVTLSDSDGFVTGGVQAQYFFTPETNLYLSYATGVKAFGFMNLPRLPVNGPYRTERSETMEIGLKMGLGGGSHLNLAVFRTLIDDYQIGVNFGPPTGFAVFNYNYRVAGFEADLLWRATPELTLSASATYANAVKLQPIRPGSITTAAFSPRFSGIAKIDYSTALSERFELNLGSFVEFRSSQLLHDTAFFANTLFGRQPGYAKVGANLGVEDRESGISLSLIADNLFNKFNYTSMFPAGATAAAVSEDRPRTIMLQISIRH